MAVSALLSAGLKGVGSYLSGREQRKAAEARQAALREMFREGSAARKQQRDEALDLSFGGDADSALARTNQRAVEFSDATPSISRLRSVGETAREASRPAFEGATQSVQDLYSGDTREERLEAQSGVNRARVRGAQTGARTLDRLAQRLQAKNAARTGNFGDSTANQLALARGLSDVALQQNQLMSDAALQSAIDRRRIVDQDINARLSNLGQAYALPSTLAAFELSPELSALQTYGDLAQRGFQLSALPSDVVARLPDGTLNPATLMGATASQPIVSGPGVGGVLQSLAEVVQPAMDVYENYQTRNDPFFGYDPYQDPFIFEDDNFYDMDIDTDALSSDADFINNEFLF